MAGTAKSASILIALLLFCIALPGCLVAGYSSAGGWWVWPGSLIASLILLLLWLLVRR
jgi:hypothetical protein